MCLYFSNTLFETLVLAIDAAKKAERSKETEQKQALYKNDMMKAAFTD